MLKLSKLLFIFLFLVGCFLLIAKPTLAQENLASPNLAPDVPKNLHTLTQSVFIDMLSTVTCQLAGIDLTTPGNKCLGVDPKTGQIGFVKQGGNGMLGIAGNMITMLYANPPAHGSDYTQYLASHFGVAGHAYAQAIGGYGYNSLKPILPLWIVFRNLTYLFVIIILVAIGLAIMLRIKIDPRTVMTIENQLPKVIIGLILITFSFAIAGFLIDLMYLFMYLAVNLIAQADKGLAINLATIQTRTAFGVVNELFPAAGPQVGPIQFGGIIGIILSVTGALKDIIGSILAGTFIGPLIVTVILAVITVLSAGAASIVTIPAGIVCTIGGLFGGNIPLIGGVAGLCGTLGVGIIDTLAAVVAFVVVSIALLFALFRVWLALLKAYVFTLFTIIFAPFFMLFGMLPGSPLGFDAWFKTLISNLLAFPVTLLFLLIGSYFMRNMKDVTGIFVPPFLGGLGNNYAAGGLGLGAQAGTSGLGAFIGFGTILLAPQVITIMQQLVKAPENKFTSAIGQTLGAGFGGAKSVIGGTAQTIFGEQVTYKSGGPQVEKNILKKAGKNLLQKFGG